MDVSFRPKKRFIFTRQHAFVCSVSNQVQRVTGRQQRNSAMPAPRVAVPKGRTVILHPAPRLNQLLAALPVEELERWLPMLEVVTLPMGAVLHESGAALRHVYFPTSAVVSLHHVDQNGASAELAVVGNEGIVGIAIFLGGETTLDRAVVLGAGQGFRLKAEAIKAEFNRSAAVMHLLLRYTQALFTQVAQTAVCNRHHTLDQQLCRWLLMSLDRQQSDELLMTQKLIADMLGFRREGVTAAAFKLQQAGLIRYARGRITVLDRPALERQSCECYTVVKKEYARLLSQELST